MTIELSVPDRVYRTGIYILAITWLGVVIGLVVHFAPVLFQGRIETVGPTEISTTDYSLRVENDHLRRRVALLNSRLDDLETK